MGWVALLVGLLCLAGCASSDSSDGMSDSSVPELPDKPLLSELNRVEQSLFWRVNDERRKGGLMPLTLKADLCRAARKHNFEMMQVGIVSHFSHEGLDIGQQLTAQGIPWNLCAENLAKMPDTKDVAQKTVEFWMSEPTGEKDILFHLYNETGLAAQKDPKTGEWFITQIYARRIGYWVP
ncbi:MAG: CAP domain-containing protein [Phycisphaerae bacterium]|nr:CAP domain-containing protein [Phycisphaerae bacterium]